MKSKGLIVTVADRDAAYVVLHSIYRCHNSPLPLPSTHTNPSLPKDNREEDVAFVLVELRHGLYHSFCVLENLFALLQLEKSNSDL